VVVYPEAQDGFSLRGRLHRQDGGSWLGALLILACLLPSLAFGGSAAIMPGFDRVPLADHLEYWVDDSGSASIQDVRGLGAAAWAQTEGPFAHGLPSNRPVWIRISVSNPSARTARGLLSLDNHLQTALSVFPPNDGAADERRVSTAMGIRDVDREARAPVYEAMVPGRSVRTWFVRLDPDVRLFSATLWEEQAFTSLERRKSGILGLVFGGLLALLLVSLAVAWWARLRRARGFEIFATVMLLTLWVGSGENLLMSQALHRLTYAAIPLQLLSLAAFLYFARSFLEPRTIDRKLDIAFLVGVGLAVCSAPVAAIDLTVGIGLSVPVLAGGLALPLFAATRSAKSHKRRTVLFLVAYAPFALGYLGPAVVHFGLTDLAVAPHVLQLAVWPIALGLFATAAAGSGVAEMRSQALNLQRSEEELREYAFKDRLTGVANRAALLDALQLRLIRVAETGHPFALVFMDLDRFKNVNDVFGHGVGDEMLRRIGSRLVATVRAEDTVARLGGDEFVVLLHSVPDETAARAEAERLLEVLAQPLMLRRQQIRTSASAGITLVRNPGARPDDLLSEADMAMHAAKSAGKGRVQTFDIALRGSAQERLELESELHGALKNNELEMHFQPILRAADNRTVGFEALMRWNHPERGWISPAAFIPVAEETGSIQELGAFALEQATAAIARWNNLTRGNLFVTVNVSSRQFIGRQVSSQVRRSLALAGCKPTWLKVELTESLLVTDFTLAQNELGRIHDLGVGLCLDDFGTGYSSLSYLHQLPLTTIKIDQAFCRDITDKPSSQAIVASVVALANGLDMDVVSEGVETVEDKRMLGQLGCHFMQGYLFGKPIPEHNVPDYLDADISVSDRREYGGAHSDKTIDG